MVSMQDRIQIANSIAELIVRFTAYKRAIMALSSNKPCPPDILETSPELRVAVERAKYLFRNAPVSITRQELDDIMEDYFKLLLFMSNALLQPVTIFVEHREFVVELVEKFIRGIIRYPSAFLALTYFKSGAIYLPCHSINVCIFSLILAHALEMSQRELSMLGMAGLLHDLGMNEIEGWQKPESMGNVDQFGIQRHVEISLELVSQIPLPHMSEMEIAEMRTAIYQHHERLDRSGYPKHISARFCTRYARVLAIADVFEAMTSPRAYRDEFAFSETVLYLVRKAGTLFDEEMVKTFIVKLVGYGYGDVDPVTEKKVLLLDRDIESARAIMILLDKIGLGAIPVLSAAEARNILKIGLMDAKLLIVDVMLQEENGFDFIRWVNENIEPCPIIVIVSGLREKSALVQAKQMKVRDYIIKPYDTGQFIERMQQIAAPIMSTFSTPQ